MKTDDSSAGNTKSLKTKWLCAVVLVLAVACVAMRLLAAWLLRNENNGDLAIVQLMVRDIVTGNGIPVFFYGQAYMGSLEPITNALTHVIFGFTNFGTEIGTAIYTLLALFFAARLARRAGGISAVVFALLFCVCGPMPFFHYAVSPRGGYGILLFISAGAIDLATDMVCRERNGKPYSRWLPFFFGALAGAGFWNNQLSAPALAAGVFCILIYAPKLLAKISLWIGGVAGFIAGSFPFWLWNLCNNFESFGLSDSFAFDRLVMARNADLLFRVRWRQLFGLDRTDLVASPVMLKIVLVATVVPFVIVAAVYLQKFFARLVIRDKRKSICKLLSPASDSAIVSLTLAFFFVIFTFCFASSHFAVYNTPRYLLPIVPVFGVVCGIAFAVTRKIIIRLATAVTVVILVFWQYYQVGSFFAMSDKHTAISKRNGDVIEFLKGRNIDSAYCSFYRNTLNVAGGGAIAFSDKKIERVPEFRRKLESSDSPVIIDNSFGMESWVKASGGTYSPENVSGIRIAADITPPKCHVRELSSDSWLSVKNSAGEDVTALLSDRSQAVPVHLKTNVGGIPGRRTYSETFTLTFKKSETLAGIRFWASEFPFAGTVSFSGNKPGTSEYIPLGETLYRDPMCIWSGPRFYPTIFSVNRGVRFDPVEVESVKISIDGGPHMANAVIYEIQTLAPLDTAEIPCASTLDEWKSGVDGLMPVLASNSVSRLYATRWVANRVYELSNGKIWTDHGDDLTPKMTGLPAEPTVHDIMSLDEHSAVLLPESGCPFMRDVARVRNLSFREIPVPLLGTLFLPDAVQSVPFGIDEPLGIMFYDDVPMLAPSGEWIANLLNKTPKPHSESWLRKLYAENPLLIPLLKEIASHPEMGDIVAEATEKVNLLSVPEFGEEAEFSEALIWCGCRFLSSPEHLRPGSEVLVRHYWKARREPDRRTSMKRTLIHIVGPGGYRFQDDYDINAMAMFFDTYMEKNGACTWHIDRLLSIPSDAPKGDFEMQVGVYDRSFASHRLNVRTELPVTRKAARILKFLTVE